MTASHSLTDERSYSSLRSWLHPTPAPDYGAAAAHAHSLKTLDEHRIRNWQRCAGALLLINAALGAGVVYLAQRQATPLVHVVEVDHTGLAQAVKLLQPTTVQDPLVVRAVLAGWLSDVRQISLDDAANQRQANRAYAMCGQEAGTAMGKEYLERLAEARREQAAYYPVKITVLPVSERTWRLRWVEEKRVEGKLVQRKDWEATAEVRFQLPTGSDVQKSPLGIWVTAFRASEI
jgi:type IV secretion system protein VirB5